MKFNTITRNKTFNLYLYDEKMPFFGSELILEENNKNIKI